MSLVAPASTASDGLSVFKRACLWLAFLGPFFYLTYGTANWLASQKTEVANIAFSWEEHIPFLQWTIIPYWSINAFYALSLFVNRDKASVDRLGARLLVIQIIAVSFFVIFPLKAVFIRPETSGLPKFMFAVLGGFDKPFNQAPSLHIALLVVLWDHYRDKISGVVRIVWHIWCVAIGLSVLTTYQHHVMDIPTGGLLGLFALWLFPKRGDLPLAGFKWSNDAKSRRIGFYYLAGGILMTAIGIAKAFDSLVWLIFLWIGLSLTIVSAAYLAIGVRVFQKENDGTISLASFWLLMPYRLGAHFNAWAWTRKLPPSVEIADHVSLGRFPSPKEARNYTTVIDMSAEFPRRSNVSTKWISFPVLDLTHTPDIIKKGASQAIEEARRDGPVLVTCALGFQRSAGAISQWLIDTGRANDAGHAVELLKKAGRPVYLKPHSEPQENR